jgi:hypothetical protein
MLTDLTYLTEIRAAQLVGINDRLNNAITDDADLPRATGERLVEIRGQLNNVGGMTTADPRTLRVILDVLDVQRPIDVYNVGEDNPEEHSGAGEAVIVHTTGRAHFLPGLPQDLLK